MTSKMEKVVEDALVTDREILSNLEGLKSKEYVEVVLVVANLLATHLSILDLLHPLAKYMVVPSVSSCDEDVAKLVCKLANFEDPESLIRDARMIAEHRYSTADKMAKTIIGKRRSE